MLDLNFRRLHNYFVNEGNYVKFLAVALLENSKAKATAKLFAMLPTKTPCGVKITMYNIGRIVDKYF